MPGARSLTAFEFGTQGSQDPDFLFLIIDIQNFQVQLADLAGSAIESFLQFLLGRQSRAFNRRLGLVIYCRFSGSGKGRSDATKPNGHRVAAKIYI